MLDWFQSLPLYWAQVIAVVLFAGTIVWAWTRPRAYIYRDAPTQKRWRDLRIWATILMIIQIILYISF